MSSCSAGIAGVRGAPAPERALWTDRSLVRTWAMRGTLHLMPADDLELWAGALADRESRRRFPPSWEREHGVTGADLHAITEAIREVVGAAPMSRAELGDAVCARLRRPDLAGPLATSWGALLKPAAARGLLCSGPADGQTRTFVSPTGWLGRALVPRDAAEANREVLLRFLGANGPATTADMARWWGEQPGPPRRWAREIADDLTPVEIDDEPGSWSPAPTPTSWPPSRTVGPEGSTVTVRRFGPVPSLLRLAAERHAPAGRTAQSQSSGRDRVPGSLRG